MGLLNTSVCAAIIGLTLVSSANAQDAGLHPQLGKKPPRETLNSDLLALPVKERAAWIHGAMSQLVTVHAQHDPVFAGCVTEWYFGAGNGETLSVKAIQKYRSKTASSTLVALSKKICSAG